MDDILLNQSSDEDDDDLSVSQNKNNATTVATISENLKKDKEKQVATATTSGIPHEQPSQPYQDQKNENNTASIGITTQIPNPYTGPSTKTSPPVVPSPSPIATSHISKPNFRTEQIPVDQNVTTSQNANSVETRAIPRIPDMTVEPTGLNQVGMHSSRGGNGAVNTLPNPNPQPVSYQKNTLPTSQQYAGMTSSSQQQQQQQHHPHQQQHHPHQQQHHAHQQQHHAHQQQHHTHQQQHHTHQQQPHSHQQQPHSHQQQPHSHQQQPHTHQQQPQQVQQMHHQPQQNHHYQQQHQNQKRQHQSSSDSNSSSLPKNEKDRFLLFTRVLMKYLEQKNPPLHAQAKKVIRECADKNKMRDPKYLSLTKAMQTRLRETVGPEYWKKANGYLEHFLEQKMKRKKEQPPHGHNQTHPSSNQGTTHHTSSIPSQNLNPQPPHMPQPYHPQQVSNPDTNTTRYPNAQNIAMNNMNMATNSQMHLNDGKSSNVQPLLHGGPQNPGRPLPNVTQPMPKNIQKNQTMKKNLKNQSMPHSSGPPLDGPNDSAAIIYTKTEAQKRAHAAARAAALGKAPPSVTAPISNKPSISSTKPISLPPGANAQYVHSGVKVGNNVMMNHALPQGQSMIAAPTPTPSLSKAPGIPLTINHPGQQIGGVGVPGTPRNIETNIIPSTLPSNLRPKKNETTIAAKKKKGIGVEMLHDKTPGGDKKTSLYGKNPKSTMSVPDPVLKQKTQKISDISGGLNKQHPLVSNIGPSPGPTNGAAPTNQLGQPGYSVESNNKSIGNAKAMIESKTKEYKELMDTLDHAVMVDWNIVSIVPREILEEEQKRLLYGTKMTPSCFQNDQSNDTNVQVCGTSQVQLHHWKGWGKRNIVTPGLAWARLRLREKEEISKKESIETLALPQDAKVLENLSSNDENKKQVVSTISGNSSFYDWYNEEKAEEDQALALLSEATQCFLKFLLEGAISSARRRKNLDGTKIWYMQHGPAPYPLSLRMGCDVKRQVALAQGNAAMTCKRLEEALSRSVIKSESTYTLEDDNKVAHLATSMFDLSKYPPKLDNAAALAHEDAKRNFEVYGGKGSNDPPFGRVPKKIRLITKDLQCSMVDSLFPWKIRRNLESV